VKKYFLFDLDGTLTDSKEGILNSLVFSLGSFGIEVPDKYELTKLLGPPLHVSFKEYFGFSDEAVVDAVAKYREYFNDKGIFENKLYDGIVEILDELKNNGATLAISTSKPTHYAEIIARHFNISHYFDVISGAEMDGSNSSKKEVISIALSKLGFKNLIQTEKDELKLRKIVMIGDREHDIIGARQVGIDGIGVTWGYSGGGELEAAGADHIVNSPKELCGVII